MLKFHPIPAFMKAYTNFKNIFLVRVFWLKYIFRIKLKIPILDLMLLPKTVFHLKGYTPVMYYNHSSVRKDTCMYWIDTVYVQNHLSTEFSKRTIL